MSRPRILVSNDDGVVAPGLRALAHELCVADFADFCVSGPMGERSAQSHCITIGKHLHAFNITVEGAQEAFAIDGTPADSVMIALYGPLLSNRTFDLVISGINRGDNCGLHVIYSGTVGAAREAACKDIPALAFSLDNHKARTEEQYISAARYAVSIIRATLGIAATAPRPLPSLRGYVINFNFPGAAYEETGYKGLHLCFQGQHCSFPDFQEVDADPHFAKESHDRGSHHHAELHAGQVTLRAFRNAAGFLRTDEREGSDSWAVHRGWVAVTPVGLPSDVPMSAEAAKKRRDVALEAALARIMKEVAVEMGVEVAGLPAGLPDGAAAAAH